MNKKIITFRFCEALNQPQRTISHDLRPVSARLGHFFVPVKGQGEYFRYYYNYIDNYNEQNSP